jgi:hypothetical protein
MEQEAIELCVYTKEDGEEHFVMSSKAREFVVVPRAGDYIEIEDDADNPTAYIYKVIAFVHPQEPAITAGDVYAVRVDVTHKVLQAFFREETP